MAFIDKAGILEAAIEQSSSPVIVTNAELDSPGPTIVDANGAFTRMTGYTRKELAGATPRMLQGPATECAVRDRLKASLRAGYAFEGHAWNYRKDGTAYQVAWMIMPLRLAGKGIDYFFAVQRDVTQHDHSSEALEHEAHRLGDLLHAAGANQDAVTGALDRRGMLLDLQRFIDEAATADSVTALVELQLKRVLRLNKVLSLKAINQLLSDIGERLGNELNPGESLARPHEHTFAVLMPVATEAMAGADGYLVARVRALIAAATDEAFDVGGDALRVTIGAGIARAPADSRDAHELAVFADEAAQRASHKDADPIRWADCRAVEREHHQLALEHSLRRAISQGELAVHYQPIVDLTSNSVAGAEALVRWPQPAGNAPIGPDEFIPLAEELGLMDRLGRRAFEQACRQLRRWQQRADSEVFWVSVNVAPDQLRDPNLTERFLAIAQAEDVSPACVKLEITESALEQSLDELNPVINGLVAAGFPLALDDFGKGHSSLARLIELPFSVIKVDRCFVWQTPDGRGASVVASLSQLTKYLKLDALGEGVETPAHEAFLRQCGYTYAQGYYYGQPVAAEDFPLMLSAG